MCPCKGKSLLSGVEMERLARPALVWVCLPLDGSGKTGTASPPNKDETKAGVLYQLVSRRLIKRPGCRKTLSRVTPAIG